MGDNEGSFEGESVGIEVGDRDGERVGLAVGDIESIQRTASLRALIDQVFLVDDIVKSYPRWILRKIYRSSLRIKPNQNSFMKW